MGGWKKFIMGDKMPDKDDPQYKEQYDECDEYNNLNTEDDVARHVILPSS